MKVLEVKTCFNYDLEGQVIRFSFVENETNNIVQF